MGLRARRAWDVIQVTRPLVDRVPAMHMQSNGPHATELPHRGRMTLASNGADASLGGTSASNAPPTRTSSRFALVARLLLAGYVFWLIQSSWFVPQVTAWPTLTLSDLQELGRLNAWIEQVIRIAVTDLLRFLPVGVLFPLTVRRGTTTGRRCVRYFGLLIVAVVAAIALRQWEMRPFRERTLLIAPALGALMGVHIGTVVKRGVRSALWLIPQLVMFLLVVAAARVWFFNQCFERGPLPFDTPPVTSAEKRRVVKQLRRSPVNQRDERMLRHVRLSDADVNFLLAWANSLNSPRRKMRVHFAQGRVLSDTSLSIQIAGVGIRYINTHALGRLQVVDTALRLRLDRLQLGRVRVPDCLLEPLSPRLQSFVAGDSNVRAVLDAIRTVEVADGFVSVVYEKGQFDKRVLPVLMPQTGNRSDVILATRAQVRQLVEAASGLPRGDARFMAFLRVAFDFARQRSEQSDPVTENLAALNALGILLGHPRLERLIGSAMDTETHNLARKNVGRVTIRGRNDWTRHFCVSAVIASWSSETVSDAVGLLKEELDADRGGSGFSFSDLLADRAGTRFGLAAIRDEASAQTMQRLFLESTSIDAVFPPSADLPEGLSDAQLQSRFGGVGGAGYQRMLAEIERRLDTCAALK